MTDAAGVKKIAFTGGKKVASITADRAYDRASCYHVAHALSAQAIIPPIRPAKPQKRTRGHPFNEALATRIEHKGVSDTKNLPRAELARGTAIDRCNVLVLLSNLYYFKKRPLGIGRSRVKGIRSPFSLTTPIMLSESFKPKRLKARSTWVPSLSPT